MLNSTLQIKVKQRINKLDSQDFDNIECWQIVEAFNKSQVAWCRRQLAGTNILKQGDEQSKRRIDDLEQLLKEVTPLLSPFPVYYETAVIPADYFEFKRLDAYASTDCCPDRRMVVYQTEEANVAVLLRDVNKKPSFDWGETFMTFIGEKARIYTNGEFTIPSAILTYYRQPIRIQVANCVDPYTNIMSTVDVESEFKDDITELIIDEAVSILAGDIESGSQFSRGTQLAERSN